MYRPELKMENEIGESRFDTATLIIDDLEKNYKNIKLNDIQRSRTRYEIFKTIKIISMRLKKKKISSLLLLKISRDFNTYTRIARRELIIHIKYSISRFLQV